MLVLEETTTQLLAELRSARAATDRLFAILRPNALYERPISQRHRVIFYIGHLESFDSIQICREGLQLASPNPQLDALFQAGIDPDSSHLPTDTPADWPSLDQIRAYVEQARSHVDNHVERAPEDALLLALEHRLMHLETLAYMFHNFDHELKQAPAGTALTNDGRESPQNKWVDIPAGNAVLGKQQDGTFGWDNEYQLVSRPTAPFRVQQNSISNGEYLRFVKDGAPLPHFWKRERDQLLYRGMFEAIPLPLDWPVYVTLDETRKYAQWLGKSLLTEEQFHRAAYGSPVDQSPRPYPWGSQYPRREHGNFDFHCWDPEPVDSSSAGRSAWGVNQLVGNGWQWTNSAFGPLPGFQPTPSYPGYSANFFDGEHFVIKGGSARTGARLLRSSFRNWFRHDYPYVYSTFRCVEN